VIKDRVSGDGGNVGRELIMVLEAAIKKYTAPSVQRPTSTKIPLNATFTRPSAKK